MKDNTSLNTIPIADEWIEYCNTLELQRFQDLPGVHSDPLYCPANLQQIHTVLRSEYSSPDAIAEDLRTAYEAYLGQYALASHPQQSKWVTLEEATHGLSGRGIYLEKDESIIVPSELLKLLLEDQESNLQLVAATLTGEA